MASLTDGILEYLNKTSKINSLELAEHFREDHQKIVGAIKSIQTYGNIICCQQVSSKQWELTSEGREVVEKGSHEALVYHAVPLTGISQAELMKQVPNAKVGFSKAMSSGWIQIDKSAKGGPKIVRKVDAIEDIVQQNLINIQNNSIPDNLKQEYKKRKLLQEIIVKSYDITKGSDFTLSLAKAETDLTPEMISTGSWKEKKFKDYNFDALGVPPTRGHLHPLMRVRTQFRQIFLEMGFSEMPTNNFIESSFWNFDALFQPQQHPARDAHDTFFISDPQYATEFPMEYLERVRRVHQHGAYGSQGYKYEWKLQDAQKNLLRTHTTAVSARMLYKLAQQEKFKPAKYFSIDRVFRNETLDATHLAEFFQIEGVVADYGLTLGNLIGILYEFFKKLGIEKLRFKPAYNPYTEPSMEIFSYHEGLKKWVEIGNSGMFRPEMLLPMGLPEKVKVIAWGLSLERPTMIKFGIDNIRDLVGHKVNLQMVYEAPICRLDKGSDTREKKNPLEILEARQESILMKLGDAQRVLESLIQQMKTEQINSGVELKLATYSRPPDVEKSKDIVILASPHNFPLSVLILSQQLGKQRAISLRTHCHSDLPEIPAGFSALLNGNNVTELTSDTARTTGNVLRVTLILANVSETKMIVNPIGHIAVDNEVNVARYLARHLDPPYDADPVSATTIDHWLDEIQRVSSGNAKYSMDFVKIVNSRLKSQEWITGNVVSLADVVLWSVLHTSTFKNLTPIIKEWINKCSKLDIFSLAKKIV